MPKLTDTQLVILSAAANRADRAALPLAKSLRIKGAAVTKTLESLLRKSLLEEKPGRGEEVAWRTDKDGRRMTLVISEAGLAALEGKPASETGKQPTSAKTQQKDHRGRARPKTTNIKTNGTVRTLTVRSGTKQAQLVDLLKRKDGATIDELVAALGWQSHSVRGAISGSLKKKLGLAVSSELIDGRGRVYRIAKDR